VEIIYDSILEAIRAQNHILESQDEDILTITDNCALLTHVKDEYLADWERGVSRSNHDAAVQTLWDLVVWLKRGHVKGKVDAYTHLRGVVGGDGFLAQESYKEAIGQISLALKHLSKKRLNQIERIRKNVKKRIKKLLGQLKKERQFLDTLTIRIQGLRTLIERGIFPVAIKRTE
jgi:hypothetical protein